MTLSDLILKVGNENVKLQRLDSSMTDIKTNKQNVSKITFETDQLTATEVALGSAKMHGLVIWLPKDKLPK